MKRTVLAIAVLAAALLASPPSYRVVTGPAPRLVAEDGVGTSVTIAGQTGQWNGTTGSYNVRESFRRSGYIYLEKNPVGSGTAVAIFSGSVVDFSAGALHFVTNSYLLRHDTAIAAFNSQAMLPVATVNESSSELVATIDPAAARTVQMNNFVVDSSAFATPKPILQGTVHVTVSGSSISGNIELYGGGYIEPGNAALPVNIYKATFSTT